jgi:hypothetical protein
MSYPPEVGEFIFERASICTSDEWSGRVYPWIVDRGFEGGDGYLLHVSLF